MWVVFCGHHRVHACQSGTRRGGKQPESGVPGGNAAKIGCVVVVSSFVIIGYPPVFLAGNLTVFGHCSLPYPHKSCVQIADKIM